MENPIKMDDLGGFTPIFGNTHLTPSQIRNFGVKIPQFGSMQEDVPLKFISSMIRITRWLFYPLKNGIWLYKNTNFHPTKKNNWPGTRGWTATFPIQSGESWGARVVVSHRHGLGGTACHRCITGSSWYVRSGRSTPIISI